MEKYVWIPYTLIGISPTTLFKYESPNQYVRTSIYTHLENRVCQFYKNNKWQSNGFVQKAVITDTTTAYRLVNKSKKLYSPVTKSKKTIRKAKHYDNNTYILKEAFYRFIHDLPSFYEKV